MPAHAADGLARVQSESRISTTTWRQWCSQLGIDADDAVEVWDSVCHPMAVVSRSMPDITYVLQMRAARMGLDIEEFKEELPALLHFNAFLGGLQDEALTGKKFRNAVLKLYQKEGSEASLGETSGRFIRRVLPDLCTALLLSKIIPGDKVNFSRMVRLLVEGKGTLYSLAGVGLKSVADRDFADEVRQCLEARVAFTAGPADGDGPPSSDDSRALDQGAGAGESAELDEADTVDDAGDEDEFDADDDDEEEEDLPPDPVEEFLDSFRIALDAVYRAEAEGNEAIPRSLLEARERAISGFAPLRARIPSLEEADRLAQRGSNDGPDRNGGLQQSGGGSGRIGGGGGSGRGARGPNPLMASKGSAAKSGPSATAAAPARSTGPARKPASGGGVAPAAGKIARAPYGAAGAVSIPSVSDGDDEAIDVPRLGREELSDVVARVAQLLGGLEARDPRVWNLFVEPASDIEDIRQLAEDLTSDDGPAVEAYGAVRIVAQQQQLKALLKFPADTRLKERRFDLEAAAFINTINNSRRGVEADSRQLTPLPKVLDYAAAAMIRLEALRSCFELISEAPADLTAETVTDRYDRILSNVTYLADSGLVDQARIVADADAESLIHLVKADHFVEQLVSAVEDYVAKLLEDGCTGSEEDLSTKFGSDPLYFEDVDASGGPGKALPAKFGDGSGLGEIVDTTRDYVFAKAWDAMQPHHGPEKVLKRLDGLVRRLMARCIRPRPRKERHEKNPRVALSVVGLDTLTGNASVSHLVVRLDMQGQLLYIEDFEDGSYIDLFEVRKNERRRMSSKGDDGAGLQSGSNYLHTVGRTSKPFGKSEADVMGACMQTEDGEPIIYPIF